MTPQHHLAVLVSGRGSNLAAIADACQAGTIPASLALVLCNVKGAAALEMAERRGLPTRCIPHGDYPDRASFEMAVMSALREADITFIALAGFMRILTGTFIREYYGSLLNIHPSLLPKYPGLDTHRRAIEAGEREVGATVHYVTPELDAGPAILHGRVAVQPEDNAESLAARVQRVEHKIYPQALAWCLRGQVSLREDAACLNGEPIIDGGIDYESR